MSGFVHPEHRVPPGWPDANIFPLTEQRATTAGVLILTMPGYQKVRVRDTSMPAWASDDPPPAETS
jgi:hypothetical protein